MSAVWFRARAELRARWRTLAALAIVAAVGGGCSLAAFAGARRTDAAYPAFLKSQQAYDVILSPSAPADRPLDRAHTFSLFSRVQALPEVASSSIVDLFPVEVVLGGGRTFSFPDVFPVTPVDGRYGSAINRWEVVRGRLEIPSRVDEAFTSPPVAAMLHVQVGGSFALRFPDGRSVAVRLVGTGWSPGQVDPSSGDYFPALELTPAFYRTYAPLAMPDSNSAVLMVRLRGGEAQTQGLLRDAALVGAPLGITGTQQAQTAGVARNTRFESVALEVFGALTALAVFAILGQLLAREISLHSGDNLTLRALGMSRVLLVAVSMAMVAALSLLAAALAIVTAYALSPLTPIGTVRQLQPNGASIDPLILGVGAAAIIALILMVCLWPSWRAARPVSSYARPEEPTKRARPADAVARGPLPVSSAVGIRLALEPGTGSRAVPVRSALFGIALGMFAFAAAVDFGSSIRNLVHTPRFAGWSWDVSVNDNPSTLDSMQRSLTADGTITSATRGEVVDLRIGQLDEGAFAFHPGIVPEVVAGRLPVRADEIALGPRAMRDLHTFIGGSVPVFLLKGSAAQTTPINPIPVNSTPYQMRVVGSVIVPPSFIAAQEVGEGTVISVQMLQSLEPSLPTNGVLFARLSPHADLQSTVLRMRQLGGPNAFVVPRSQPTTLTNLQRIGILPDLLAGLLVLLSVGALIHALSTSVQRRRKDLAILKSLGFERGQVRAAVIWQATSLVVIALAVGLPLGAIAGVWGWRAFVDQLGFVPRPVVPLATVLLAIPAALLLGNLIASWPARAAARTKPAIVLRTE